MANVKFSGLPAATTVAPTDITAIVQGGVSKKAAFSTIFPSGATDLALTQFDGTTGTKVKAAPVTVSAAGIFNGFLGISVSATQTWAFTSSSSTTTFPLYTAAGSNTAPSYSFSGDTNTGIYSTSADAVNIAAGGASALQADTTGVTVANRLLAGTTSYNSTTMHQLVNQDAASRYIQLLLTGTMTQVSGGSQAYCALLQPTFNSGAGSTFYDVFNASPTISSTAEMSFISLFNGAFTFSGAGARTFTTVANFYANTDSTGGFGGTITNRYGFRAPSITSGTNRYGASFAAPTGGTINIAMQADNGAFGYNVTPPTNGVIISGQTAIGTSTPAASALLTLSSTTLGFLPPVMTTAQRNLISSPATGLVIYDSTALDLVAYNGSAWIGASSSGVTSITGTANQVIASASTGAITLSLPQSIATSSSVQFGKLGINGAASSSTDLNVFASSTNQYAAYFGGTLNGNDGASEVGAYFNHTLSPTANNINCYGMILVTNIVPQSTNTIPLATGGDFTLTGTIGSGTVTSAYSARFFAPGIGTARAAIYADNMLIGFSGITPGTNSIHVAGVSSFGTSTYLADTTVPVQLNATAGVARYFGVNKAGNYGLLVGFDNASGLGTGCHFRCVTTDSIYFFVNNTVQAAQINSSGQWMFNTTTAAGTLAVGAQSSGATVKMTNDTANAGTFVFQTSNSSGVNGSSIQLTHTRGSNASPTATQSGDVLGSVGFGGYGTSINNAGAVIFGVAAQTWTGSANGSDIWFYTTKTGATSNSETFRLSANGNVVCGGNNGAALATSATDGFLYLPTCAGTPTGVPTSYTGRVAALFDTTANKIWVYDGAWLQTAALT